MITTPAQKFYSGLTKPSLNGFRISRNLILFLFLFSIFTQVGMAQTNNTIVPSPVMPISPNASSLAIFTDYPVSHYTGVPDISVPLYQADIDGFKLPITLSYHASGIQVNQESSWVGLGWALNVGGSISRSIKGGDDFLEYLDAYTLAGYYKDQDLDNPSDNQRYYLGTPGFGNNRLIYDTEPDIFYYSLPGASGKFVIDKSRGPVLMDKSPNVKIEIIHDTNISNSWNTNLCFQITTTDGTKYYYKQRETTRSYSYGLPLNQNSTDPNRILDGGLGPNTPFEYTSSWMLAKITTLNKREINFQYTLESYESPTQETCSKSNTLMVNGGGCASFPGNGAVAYQSSKTRHEALRLTSIQWDQGHIDFTASTREDMRGWLMNAPPKNWICFKCLTRTILWSSK
nr:hypothetical protein [uncultured Pedobacter sp.]